MIEVENLSKIFRKDQPPAVKNISFSIQKGSILGIIGTSGSGKTTVLKMLNQLIKPTTGQVYVEGQSYQSKNVESWRRNMGYVVQSSGLLPHLTVVENIDLLPIATNTSNRKSFERAKELLELVGLDPSDFAFRYPKDLSGGEAQRVGIARALRNDPAILLMDEPFGALDPITRIHLQDEFLAMNRRLEKTIVFVTHDLGEAFKMSDSIILMDQGLIIQQGTRDEFLNRPETGFVKKFIDAHLI